MVDRGPVVVVGADDPDLRLGLSLVEHGVQLGLLALGGRGQSAGLVEARVEAAELGDEPDSQ